MLDKFLELADQYEAKAIGIRRRVPNASPSSQLIMNAEAAAYERVCRSIRAEVEKATDDDEPDGDDYAQRAEWKARI